MVQPVELLNTHTTRITFTRSPSGTSRGRQVMIPRLKPAGLPVHTLTGAHGLDRRPCGVDSFQPSIATVHEFDAQVGFPIRLDLNDLRVQRSVETRRCRQRVDELREHAVRVGV